MSIYTLQNHVDQLQKLDIDSMFENLPEVSERLSSEEINQAIVDGKKNKSLFLKVLNSILSSEKDLSIESIKRNIPAIAKYSNTEIYEVKKVIESYLLMKIFKESINTNPPRTPNSQALFSQANNLFLKVVNE